MMFFIVEWRTTDLLITAPEGLEFSKETHTVRQSDLIGNVLPGHPFRQRIDQW